MSTALAPSRPWVPVPAQYLGQARLLRDAVHAEDQRTGMLLQSLADRAHARAKRSAIPRVDTLVGIAETWQRDMPQRGRLRLETALDKRGKSLVVSEMRLTSSVYQPQGWTEPERGLLVNLIVLRAEKFLCRFDVHTLAHLGLHAIGRWYQRALDGSESALKRDLLVLAQAHHGLADRPDGSDFQVAVQGGSWRGNITLVIDPRIGTDRALAVRTFIPDGV